MKYINLTKGHKAIVNDSDYDFLNQWKWHFDGRYAARTQWNKVLKKDKKIYMHKLLLKCSRVDHKDGNKLNNQRNNLRSVTSSQNNMNQKPQKRKKHSKYKGVSFDKSRNKWIAYCKKDGVLINLGRFTHEKEAAQAYNLKAVELFGEYAYLNEVD